MKISDGILNTKEAVMELLKEDASLRDNDTLLLLAYLNKHHNLKNRIGWLAYEKLIGILTEDNAPKFESIRRVRAYIQNDLKLYQGTCTKGKMEEADEVRNVILNELKGVKKEDSLF